MQLQVLLQTFGVLRPLPSHALKCLRAGWMCHVGSRLLRVAAVEVNLHQNGHVHKDLEESTDGELEGSLIQEKVHCLEGVPTGPHQHHLDT